MDGVALKPLSVDFHETGFITGIAKENNQHFWFQMSSQERQEIAAPWGAAKAQALNRYSYVQNNPIKYTDPSGHTSAWVDSYSYISTKEQAENVLSVIRGILIEAGLDITITIGNGPASGSTTGARIALGDEFYEFLISFGQYLETALEGDGGWGNCVVWFERQIESSCGWISCAVREHYSFGLCPPE